MQTITIKSLKKIEQEFKNNKDMALTRNSIASKLKMNFYTVNIGLCELEQRGIITKINSSSNGDLFIIKMI